MRPAAEPQCFETLIDRRFFEDFRMRGQTLGWIRAISSERARDQPNQPEDANRSITDLTDKLAAK
jgi:hypothetical protein